MTFRLGLTGGIGMGKTSTAGLFRDLGHPVWDADAVVHRLYAPGGAAVGPVGAAFPSALRNGGIDRAALKAALADDPAALGRLEAIVHPLAAADRADFLARHAAAPLVVMDIPLLFENGYEGEMDGVAAVSVPPEIQRQRVLARPGMTADLLALILSRQMPDVERRARADWIIPTDSPAAARHAVDCIVKEVIARA